MDRWILGRWILDRWIWLYVAGTMVSIFFPLILAFMTSGKRWRAAQEKARSHRIAEYRINARLLRLDI